MPVAGTLCERYPLPTYPCRVEMSLENAFVDSVHPAPSRGQLLAADAPGGPSHIRPSTPTPKLNTERLNHARPGMPYPPRSGLSRLAGKYPQQALLMRLGTQHLVASHAECRICQPEADSVDTRRVGGTATSRRGGDLAGSRVSGSRAQPAWGTWPLVAASSWRSRSAIPALRCSDASISSRLRPLVSGTRALTKMNASTPITA